MFWFLNRWFWSPVVLAKQDAQGGKQTYVEIPLYQNPHAQGTADPATPRNNGKEDVAGNDTEREEAIALPANVRKIV